MKRAVIATFGVVLIASACQSGSSDRLARTSTASVRPIAPATAVQTVWGPPERPTPVVFARGVLISRGDLSLFLLDPATGVTEGWGTSADGRCTVRGATGDGSKLLFDCGRSPASAPATDTYALDLSSGAWALVPQRPELYGIVAPNGQALTSAAAAAINSVLGNAAGFTPTLEWWSPSGSAFVLTVSETIRVGEFALKTYLIRTDSDTPVGLAESPSAQVNPGEQIEVMWAPDGSRFALVDCCDQPAVDAITVYDSTGHKIWSHAAPSYHGNPRWSPDSRWLGIQVQRPAPAQVGGAYGDLDVFDGTSGQFAFRLLDAVACAGPYWTADDRLLVDSWQAQLVVNPRTGTMLPLKWWVIPSPTDPDLGIATDRKEFRAVNLSDGSSRVIGITTLTPAWEDEPIFAGSRIMFRPAPPYGHGGCEEGIGVPENSRPQLQFPPFPSH